MSDLAMTLICLIFVVFFVKKLQNTKGMKEKVLPLIGTCFFSIGILVGVVSLIPDEKPLKKEQSTQGEEEKTENPEKSRAQQAASSAKPVEAEKSFDNTEDLLLAQRVMNLFSESKLPINNVRDNTAVQQSLYKGLRVFLSSNPVTVMVFENDQSAQKEKNTSSNFYVKGKMVIWIKDESNKDSYLKIFNEQKPINGLKVNYFSDGIENFVKNMDGYDFTSFAKNFYKLSNKEMKTIFNLYLYKHEVTWNGTVIETGKKKVAIWGGNPSELPNSWTEASEDNGKNLAAYVIFLDLDEKQVANLRRGDKIRFSGKISSGGHLKTNDHWKVIEGKIL